MQLFSRIKRQLFRSYFRIGAVIHVRHWRGHGIHSPFMYSIVRKVFMKSRIIGKDRTLYQALMAKRVGRKHAIVLQNLYTHCHMESFTIVASLEQQIAPGRTFCILLPHTPIDTIVATARRAAGQQASLVLLAPHRSSRRWKIAQQIWQHFPCVSVDRRVMTLYFFDPKLQPQHYRI